jgi:hypothetical protein
MQLLSHHATEDPPKTIFRKPLFKLDIQKCLWISSLNTFTASHREVSNSQTTPGFFSVQASIFLRLLCLPYIPPLRSRVSAMEGIKSHIKDMCEACIFSPGNPFQASTGPSTCIPPRSYRDTICWPMGKTLPFLKPGTHLGSGLSYKCSFQPYYNIASTPLFKEFINFWRFVAS